LMMRNNFSKNKDTSTVKVYTFPNLNSDEAAIMVLGHHSHVDGIAIL
jgi:hypothetical protein